MDLAILVWLISILGGITVIFGITAGIMGICSIIALVAWIDECLNESLFSYLRWFIPIGLFCLLMAIIIPSQKTAYMMVGAYATQKVAENPKVQDMSGKVLTIIEQRLDGYINDGIKEAEDKIKKASK